MSMSHERMNSAYARPSAGIPPRRMFLWVTLIVVALIVLTIALQTLGVAPPMRLTADSV